MVTHVKSYVKTHLGYWDLYLALVVTAYISLMLYLAFMWGVGDFYSEATGLPITDKASAFLKPITLMGAILSVLFVFANVNVVKCQQLASRAHRILLFSLYQVMSFLYLVGIGYILFFVIRSYLIG